MSDEVVERLARDGRYGEAVAAALEGGGHSAGDEIFSALQRLLQAGDLIAFYGLYHAAQGGISLDIRSEILYCRSFFTHFPPLADAGRRRERSVALLEVKWPGFPRDFTKALHHLSDFKKPQVLTPARFHFLCQANQVTTEGQSAFLEEILWGSAAELLFSDLSFVDALERKEFVYSGPVNWDAFVSEMDALRRSGESILHVGAHIGPLRIGGYRSRRTEGAALYMVSAANRDGPKAFVNVRKDPQKAIYQAVKHLRTPGSIAMILGDGPFEGPGYTVPVCGRNITFPLGPAFIAFQTRAQPCWSYMGWEGSDLVLKYALGPKATVGEKYASWLERWFGFYAECLERALIGNPRDVRGYGGGIWWLLGREERAMRLERRRQRLARSLPKSAGLGR